jgi:hypothetical protein
MSIGVQYKTANSYRHDLLAATVDKFIVIRIRKFSLEEITSEFIPMNSIRNNAADKLPLFYNPRIDLSNGRSYVFEEMVYDWAAGLRDAIDLAQDKSSTVD